MSSSPVMYPTDIETDHDATPTKKRAIPENPSQMDIDGADAETPRIRPLRAQADQMEDIDLDGENAFQTPLVLRRKVVELDDEPDDEDRVMERKNKVSA
jgi:hypothetical protein